MGQCLAYDREPAQAAAVLLKASPSIKIQKPRRYGACPKLSMHDWLSSILLPMTTEKEAGLC